MASWHVVALLLALCSSSSYASRVDFKEVVGRTDDVEEHIEGEAGQTETTIVYKSGDPHCSECSAGSCCKSRSWNGGVDCITCPSTAAKKPSTAKARPAQPRAPPRRPAARAPAFVARPTKRPARASSRTTSCKGSASCVALGSRYVATVMLGTPDFDDGVRACNRKCAANPTPAKKAAGGWSLW